jgi:nucleotide-binding universal stress UspA family protein
MRMERNRWIVVGIDFSDGSARALEYAMRLAADIEARVACVYAYEDALATPALHDPSLELRQQIEEAISGCSWGMPEVRVEPIVRRGAPWDKVLNVATELGAELIVVGADGQRGCSRDGFLGTVAIRLASISSRPVVVVPARPPVARTPSIDHVEAKYRPD